jgi:hypothetical protein
VRILAVAAASFVVHATPTVQQFGDFNVTHDSTLRGLTKVFGPYDDCAVFKQGRVASFVFPVGAQGE